MRDRYVQSVFWAVDLGNDAKKQRPEQNLQHGQFNTSGCACEKRERERERDRKNGEGVERELINYITAKILACILKDLKNVQPHRIFN
jgi:hypothetical protein